MSTDNLKSQVDLFKSIFKGREDVFAVRWEKGSKSGYMPAYFYDKYRYRTHKMKGGTFQNFTEKAYLLYSDEQIEMHLKGQQLIGIYPLLKDNTSWFIVADFDKTGWEDECKAFIKACTENNIPAYLERSRSGKGGHVWIFFDKPYPAVKSRKIFISLLQKTGVFSIFDKNSSFDRLFPNQDSLSGKGFGNLIALPLYKPTWDLGNSCFIDLDTFKPFENQWEFLKSISRISTHKLDILCDSISPAFTSSKQIKSEKEKTEKLLITLNNTVKINRNGLPQVLISYLRDELNFVNTEYIIKKKMGKNIRGTKYYFKCIEETGNVVIIPRGTIGKLLRFCKQNKIEYDFNDERQKKSPVEYTCDIHLRDYQIPALEVAEKKDIGIIVAPPGTGKTVIGRKRIAEKKEPALIVVHRKQLADQWVERIQAFFGIPKNEIGIIGGGKAKIGKKITIAMIQSLQKELAKSESDVHNTFGTIIIDECHHVPAESFSNAISQLKTYYIYGLTATPFRKYSDGKLIFIHLGEIISELKPQNIKSQKVAKIIIRNTDLNVPFNSKTDRFETLSNVLIHDSQRNNLIINDIVSELKTGRKIVVLTERKEHIETLNQYLKQKYEIVTLSGNDTESSRNSKWKILKEGNYQALITTGQFFGEGSDLHNAESLFLVYPFSFKGKLIQYIGRVQRSEIAPTIYDYRDIKIDYLNRLFLKRNTWYRKLERQTSLFDEPKNEKVDKERSYIFEQQVKVPFEQLEFRYGSFVFCYKIKEVGKELEFEIDNDDIRPEFEVLKPYFAKLLNLRKVNINLFAEFLDDNLVSQIAHSSDLEKFDREIIDSVKFKFVAKHYFGKTPDIQIEGNLLDLNQLQTVGNGKLFGSEEELLENILKDKTLKHYRHIRYLASRHAKDILKIRFVLSPFSFVFLLSGAEQFHIIMETLDTEEATYIWHVSKDIVSLKKELKKIDTDINLIRNDGRQVFLENQPQNFARIIHDYTEDRKGFIVWKDLLEEILF
jgi:superfamily II DNA or RNA helicase